MKITFEVLITVFIAAAAFLIIIKHIKSVKNALNKGCSHSCSSCPYCNNNQCKKFNKKL